MKCFEVTKEEMFWNVLGWNVTKSPLQCCEMSLRWRTILLFWDEILHSILKWSVLKCPQMKCSDVSLFTIDLTWPADPGSICKTSMASPCQIVQQRTFLTSTSLRNSPGPDHMLDLWLASSNGHPVRTFWAHLLTLTSLQNSLGSDHVLDLLFPRTSKLPLKTFYGHQQISGNCSFNLNGTSTSVC